MTTKNTELHIPRIQLDVKGLDGAVVRAALDMLPERLTAAMRACAQSTAQDADALLVTRHVEAQQLATDLAQRIAATVRQRAPAPAPHNSPAPQHHSGASPEGA